MDQLPRLGKRELICLLLFTCNYVVFVWRGFLFLCVLGMGYVILLWHSLSLPYNFFASFVRPSFFLVNSIYSITALKGTQIYILFAITAADGCCVAAIKRLHVYHP